MSLCWTLAIIYTVWFHSPIQRSHHAVWSNLDCRYWRPQSRTTRNPHWEENEIHQSLFLLICVGIFYGYCRDIVILNSSGQNKVVVKDSQLLRVSSLSDDPSELHLSTGIHLEPVDGLLRLCTPRAAVQILVIPRALQETTQLLSGLVFHPDNWFEVQTNFSPSHPKVLSVYLHVESPPLSREAVVRLRGSQQLVVFHPVRLQAKRRTLWEETRTGSALQMFQKEFKTPTAFILGKSIAAVYESVKGMFFFLMKAAAVKHAAFKRLSCRWAVVEVFRAFKTNGKKLPKKMEVWKVNLVMLQ